MAQNKTVELREELQNVLKTISDNIYYDIRPEVLAYPSIVYKLWEIRHEYGQTLISLEIDILDYGTSTTQVENMADELQHKLHKYYFINDTIQFAVYRGTRNSVEEDDKKTIRRRLTFEIHLHERSSEL